MSESVKQRMGGSHLGGMNEGELRKLFVTILSDLAAIRSTVNNLVADMNNVQVVTNNIVSGLGNERLVVNRLVTDINRIANNLGTGNNVAVNANAVVTNLNAQTFTSTTPSNLNLVA